MSAPTTSNVYKAPLRRDIQHQRMNEDTSLSVALKLDGLRLLDSNSAEKKDSTKEAQAASLECHFKWIREFTPVNYDLIVGLKEKMTSWIDESTDVYMNVCVTVTQYLLLSLYDTYLRNYPEALKCIIDLELALEQAEITGQEPVENMRVFQYVLLANRLNILCWMTPTKAEEQINNEHQMIIEASLETISKIDVSGPKCEAAFLALKAQLLNQLGKTDTIVEMFRKIVLLNPDFYYWNQQLYSALRKQRRDRTLDEGPGEEEKSACTKALKQQPECSSTLVNVAQMYEEILRSNRKTLPPSERDEYSLLVIQCLQSAFESNPNSISINIRMAEVLANPDVTGKYSDRKKSEELFKLCEKKWPQNSQVMHKFGKFYINVIQDKAKGKEYFERGLQANYDNFPCLMDYIKVRQNQDSIDQIIKLVDFYIPKLVNKTYCGKLMIVKGLLLWNQKRCDDAVELWLEAFHPNSSSGLINYLKDVLKGRHCIRQLARPINPTSLRAVVSRLKLNAKLDVTGLEQMDTLVKDLPIYVHYENGRPRNNSTGGSSDGGHTHWAPKPRTTSVNSAEEQDKSDWRTKKSYGEHRNGAGDNQRDSNWDSRRPQDNPHHGGDKSNNRHEQEHRLQLSSYEGDKDDWNRRREYDKQQQENMDRNEYGRPRSFNYREEYARGDNMSHGGRVESRHQEVGKRDDNYAVRKRREDQPIYKVTECIARRQRNGYQSSQGPKEDMDDNWRKT